VARIEPIPMDQAQGKARELLDELVERGGEPGPMVRAMANAPALLRGYLDLTRAMKRSHIDRRVTERINLAVHEWLGCDYCLVAHTRAARRLGVPDNEIQLARQGTSSDPAVAAIVAFAQQVLAAPPRSATRTSTGCAGMAIGTSRSWRWRGSCRCSC
jgi:AhpD family alkylhydroperoxidase